MRFHPLNVIRGKTSAQLIYLREELLQRFQRRYKNRAELNRKHELLRIRLMDLEDELASTVSFEYQLALITLREKLEKRLEAFDEWFLLHDDILTIEEYIPRLLEFERFKQLYRLPHDLQLI